MIKVWKEEGIHPSYLNKKEKRERYNLYVNKCQVLKIIDLLKMSFRINLKCNVHNILISNSKKVLKNYKTYTCPFFVNTENQHNLQYQSLALKRGHMAHKVR
jgi:hypothetical protein